MSEEKPVIAYEDFARLDLRIARVLEAHDHPNADKLICMKIDLGGEQRQIIGGLKPWYTAEDMVGRDVVVVANLQPRKVRGMESRGMLLAGVVGAGDAQKVVIVTPVEALPPGTPVS